MRPLFRLVLATAAVAIVTPAPGSAQVRARPAAGAADIAAPQSTRAVDAFLKIGGVEGEATDRAHQGWIDVLSVSWGSADSARGRTGPAGNGSGTLTVTRRVDRATPKLSEACAGGRSLGSIVVHTPESGAMRQYVLDDVRVSSCSQGAGGDRPTETLTLNYSRLSASTSPDGNPDRPIVVGR